MYHILALNDSIMKAIKEYETHSKAANGIGKNQMNKKFPVISALGHLHSEITVKAHLF